MPIGLADSGFADIALQSARKKNISSKT